MTEKPDSFTSENVLVAVSRELKVPVTRLRIAVAPSLFLSVPGDPIDHFLVTASPCTTSASALAVTVHRNKASAESRYATIIADWLSNGRFFRSIEPTPALFKAVLGVCDLSGLIPWITSAVRQGWISDMPEKGQMKTVDAIREAIKTKLADLLKDYETAVLFLCDHNLEEAISVVIEQCDFDEHKLCVAVLEACGGWESFSVSNIVARLDEGFLAEAENDWTADYMSKLYEAQGTR